MELYFVRHGDAEPAGVGRGDADRQLTDRGRKETRAVAEAALRAGIQPEIVLTSPLLRARQTADILAQVFGAAAQVEERLSSGCGFADVQETAAKRGGQRTMFVLHEPDASQIVGLLVGRARVKMRKSGLARVVAERVEPGEGMLMSLVSPEFFARE